MYTVYFIFVSLDWKVLEVRVEKIPLKVPTHMSAVYHNLISNLCGQNKVEFKYYVSNIIGNRVEIN